jgi:hypothetical protein
MKGLKTILLLAKIIVHKMNNKAKIHKIASYFKKMGEVCSETEHLNCSFCRGAKQTRPLEFNLPNPLIFVFRPGRGLTFYDLAGRFERPSHGYRQNGPPDQNSFSPISNLVKEISPACPYLYSLPPKKIRWSPAGNHRIGSTCKS